MLHGSGRVLAGAVLLVVVVAGAEGLRASSDPGRRYEAGDCAIERITVLEGLAVDQVVSLDDRVVFVGRDVEAPTVFVTDGTAEGTRPLRDLRTDGGGRPNQLTRAGDLVFFVADDGHAGAELWATDGTFDGTRLVRDIRVGPEGSAPRRLLGVGDLLHFVADDGFHGREPWVSDGTEDGTFMVEDIEIGRAGSDPGRKVFEDDRVWFTATDSQVGVAIWETNGTRAGTRRVTLDFANGPEQPRHLGVLDGRVFFSAAREPYGRELWVSDGTVDGTAMVQDIFPGENDSDPGLIFPAAGAVWFAADDGAAGRELWRSDGTSRGTYMVSDVRPGSRGSNPSDVFAIGDLVLFVADDGSLGRELWRSDGTLTGTDYVRDINGGPDGAFRTEGFLGQMVFGDRVVFVADDGRIGREPWVTDGSYEGTQLLGNLNPDGSFRGIFDHERRQGLAPFGGGVVLGGRTDLGPSLWWLRCGADAPGTH